MATNKNNLLCTNNNLIVLTVDAAVDSLLSLQLLHNNRVYQQYLLTLTPREIFSAVGANESKSGKMESNWFDRSFICFIYRKKNVHSLAIAAVM